MPMSRTSSAALVALGSAVAVLATGTTVAAGPMRAAAPTSTASVSDPRNDLQSSAKPKRAKKVDRVHAEGKASRGPDIVKVRYENMRDRLRVVIRLTDVKYAQEIAVFARQPGPGPLRNYTMSLVRQIPDDELVPAEGNGAGQFDQLEIDGEDACPAAKFSINPKTDVVRINVPRMCLTWPDELVFATESRRYWIYTHGYYRDDNALLLEDRRYVWQRDSTKQSSATTRG